MKDADDLEAAFHLSALGSRALDLRFDAVPDTGDAPRLERVGHRSPASSAERPWTADRVRARRTDGGETFPLSPRRS